jgi:hypothetical protein
MSDNSNPGEYDVARPGLDKQPRQGHITNKESQRRRDGTYWRGNSEQVLCERIGRAE